MAQEPIQQRSGKLTNDLLFFSPIARSHRYRVFLQIEASNTVNGLLMIGRNVAVAGEPSCLAARFADAHISARIRHYSIA